MFDMIDRHVWLPYRHISSNKCLYARKHKGRHTCLTGSSPIYGEPGDYQVTFNGTKGYVSEKMFEAAYILVEPEEAFGDMGIETLIEWTRAENHE